MGNKYLWRVRCIGAHNGYVYRWLDTDVIPTICLDNDDHSINTTTDPPKLIKVEECSLTTVDEGELTRTGKFNLTFVSSDITAGAGVITTLYKYWDYPVGALKMSFDISPNMKGDTIAMFFNKFKTIGVITANVSVPTSWISQNYTAGDMVTYTFNNNTYTYTCINNTISNDPPRVALTGLVNSAYWRKGLRLSLTADMIHKINDGYMARLTDGTNADYLGEIWYVDSVNNYIYVGNKHTTDTPLTNSYLASTPTYFQTGYQMVGDVTSGPFVLNESWHRQYGEDKIGAALINEETIVSIEYTNVDGASGKKFVAEVEVLRGSGTHQ